MSKREMSRKTPLGVTDIKRVADPDPTAVRTARWAKIMTKWLISHSSKGGVKWKLVDFNGKKGGESRGIVDLIAIRKNHHKPAEGSYRGDLFEIVLIQVKGGTAKLPSNQDVKRLMAVKKYHRADKVVLAEWRKARKLSLYELPNIGTRWTQEKSSARFRD